MRRHALAAIFIAASCAQVGPVLYRTPCGVQVRAIVLLDGGSGGWPVDWSEQRLHDAETEALAEFQAQDSGVAVNACARLADWNLYPYPEPTWRDNFGKKVAGVTNCSKSLSIIGSDDPRRNALAHEFAHTLQRCDAPLPVDLGLDGDHANWNRDHIYDAIEALYVAGQVYRSAASVRPDAGPPVHALPPDWPEVLR